MSEKSPAGAAIPGLAFSGRAERALLGARAGGNQDGILQYKVCRGTLKMSRKAKMKIPEEL